MKTRTISRRRLVPASAVMLILAAPGPDPAAAPGGASLPSDCYLSGRTPTSCECPGDFIVTGDSVGSLAALDADIETYMRVQQIPNGSMAVVDGTSRLVLMRGYTNCDAFPEGEEQFVTQHDSRFRIASVSKPLTAIAVMQLIDGGQLRFSDRMLAHVGNASIGGDEPVDPRMTDITIDHLLKHRAGWDKEAKHVGSDLCATELDSPRDPMKYDAEIAGVLNKTLPIDQHDIIKFMNSCSLDSNPGERYAYSNYGFMVLGKIIENVTGAAYDAVVERMVTQRVGARDTQLAGTLESERADNEVRYYVNPWDIPPYGTTYSEIACQGLGIPDPVRFSALASERIDGDPLANRECVYHPYGRYNLGNMAPHGGWISTTTDLVRVGRDLTERRIRDGKNVLLPARRIRQMFTGEALSSSAEATACDQAYGRGWFLNSYRCGDRYHHGSINGTEAALYIFPSEIANNDGNPLLNDVVLALIFNQDGATDDGDENSLAQFGDLMHTLVDPDGALNSFSAADWGSGDLFDELP